MNRYNIILNVRGSHIEGEEENTLELYTEGMLTHEDGRYIIEYDESEISGVENTKTRLTIEDESVWLSRSGSIVTDFLFYERKTYEAAYETPFGMMQMSVLPTQILSDLSAEKGNIDLEYVVKIGDQSALNRLNIHYRQLKN